MNIALWVLQGLLAVHTLMGAIWKFKNNPEQTMPTLKAIPLGAWRGIAVFEIICAIGLIAPAFFAEVTFLVPLAAIGIGAVMVLYCVLHLASGAAEKSPMIYWVVVALVCAIVAYGRFTIPHFAAT